MGKVTLEWLPHPVTDEGRVVESVPIAAGATVVDALGASRVIDTELLPGCAVEVDGSAVEIADPALLRDGAIVAVRPRAHGSALPTLGQIALIGAILFVPGALGLTGIAAAALSAGIAVVGGLVLSALTSTPDVDTAGGALPAIGAASNRLRPYESLPLVLGECRVWLDYAVRPWTSFHGAEERIHEIFHLGFGTLQVSDISFDDNTVADLDAETEIVTHGQPALVPESRVSEQPGPGELIEPEWVDRRSPSDTVRSVLEFEWLAYSTSRKGKPRTELIGMRAEWMLDGQETITRGWLWASKTPLRRRAEVSVELPVPGPWLVRVRRTRHRRSQGGRSADVVQYLSVRSHRSDDNDYLGENRLAVVRSTAGGFSGRAGTCSAVVGQVVPVWDADTQTWGAPRVSANPAAALRAYARGFFVEGRRVAGLGLHPARIDDTSLGAWYEYCDVEGLTFGLAMQGGWTHDRFLRAVTAAGFASVSWATGRLGVVVDRGDLLPTALAHPGNVILDSLEVVYAPPGPDEVVVRYADAVTRQTESLRVVKPSLGEATPETTVTVTAPGVTDEVHAGLVGARLVGEGEFHPRRITWEMAREGRSFSRGRVALVAASILGDGVATGRLRRADSVDVLVADRDMDGYAGEALVLRAADGLLHQTTITAVAGAAVTIADALPETVLEDVAEDMIWAVYPAGAERRVRIVEQTPLSERRWRIRAQDDSAEFYERPPPPPPPPRELVRPEITSVEWFDDGLLGFRQHGSLEWALRIDLGANTVIHDQTVYAGLAIPPPLAGRLGSGDQRRRSVSFLAPSLSAPVFGLAVEYSVAGGERMWSDIAYADAAGLGRAPVDRIWDTVPVLTGVGWVEDEFFGGNQHGSLTWSLRWDPNGGVNVHTQRVYAGARVPALQAEITDSSQRRQSVSFAASEKTVPVFGLAVEYSVGGGERVWTEIMTASPVVLVAGGDPGPGTGDEVTAPRALQVRIAADGTRVWSWAGDAMLEHELRVSAAIVDWDAMSELATARGLTVETTAPAGGTWWFELRALSDEGTSTGLRRQFTLPELPAGVVPLAEFGELRTEARGKRTDDRPLAAPPAAHTYYELRNVCPTTEQRDDTLWIYLDHVYRSWRWDGAAYQVVVDEVTWRQAGGGWPGAMGVPPKVLGAEVAAAALTIRYDEPLDEDAVPPAGAWMVLVGAAPRAVSAVAIAGAEVRLTLSMAVAADDVVVVSYDPPAVEALVDKEGIRAAALAALPVTNATA